MSNKKLVLPNGQSLLEYCIENGLNFSCIYYSIHTYGKTMEEAIKHYREKGQEIPSSWIYEKYGILLKHLLFLSSQITIIKQDILEVFLLIVIQKF